LEQNRFAQFRHLLHKPYPIINCLSVDCFGLWAICTLSGDVSVVGKSDKTGLIHTVYYGKQVRRDSSNTNKSLTVCGPDLAVINSKAKIDVIHLGKSLKCVPVVRPIKLDRKFKEVFGRDDLLFAIDDDHLYLFNRISRYRLTHQSKLVSGSDQQLHNLTASAVAVYVTSRASLFVVSSKRLRMIAHRAGDYRYLAEMLTFAFKNLELLLVTFYGCRFELIAFVAGQLVSIRSGSALRPGKPASSTLHTVVFDDKNQRLLFSGTTQLFTKINLSY